MRPDDLGTLPPVSLEDLVDEAALQTRMDRKYLLDAAAARATLATLPAGTRVLEIGGHRSFGYRSVYFDTPELDSFAGTAHPRRRRFKVRTRHYLGSGENWLEVKTRGPRGLTVKTRRLRSTDAAAATDRADGAPGADITETLLSRSDQAFVAEVLRDHRVPDIDVTELRPVLGTRYERSTLVLPTAARCTIDTRVTWQDVLGNVLSRPDLVIVESKTGSTPSPVDRSLWRLGIRPSRFSKFGSGLAALHPGLPANRWHPVLADVLAPTA